MALQKPPMQNWQPPQGYRQVESTLAGITVFAPIPKSATSPTAPTSFTCPNCGAATRFDVAAGEVACEHCGYIAHVQAKQVGRQAESFEFTLSTLNQAQHGYGTARRQLHCKSCGAEFAIAETALTATCPFCSSNEVDVSAAFAPLIEQLRPRFLIPFKIQAAA